MGFVDAFARQQLEGLEQIKRDFGRRPRQGAEDRVRRSRRRSRARR
jgi:hypothetical protein